MKNKHIALGILFGFILSRAGATSYDAIAGMFRLTDLHLFGVIGTAVALNAIAFFLVKRFTWHDRGGEPLAIVPKPWTRGVILGGIVFGVGWALSGTCPGTVLAQIGEGRVAGLVIFAGILGGTWIAQWQSGRTARHQRWKPAKTPIEPRSVAVQ